MAPTVYVLWSNGKLWDRTLLRFVPCPPDGQVWAHRVCFLEEGAAHAQARECQLLGERCSVVAYDREPASGQCEGSS